MAEERFQTSPDGSYLDLIKHWSTKKKIGLALIVLICGALLVILIQLFRFSDYQLLYGDLSSHDLSSIGRWLDLREINYKIDPQLGNIYISANQIHQARIEMAEQQLPSDSNAAFDLLDRNQLALVDAVSSTDYRIALQRDLSRTVSALNHVQSARVHLNIPGGSSGLKDSSSAIVLVTVEPGRTLTAEQLQGISYLISRAVSGLPAEQIKIVDSSGKLLSRGAGYTVGGLFSTDSLSYQTAVEKNLEKRALDIVETMIGVGQAFITVTAEIDYTRSETTAEIFDPEEPVIRKEESQYQPVNPEPVESGLSIAPSNSYQPPVTAASKTDYEINKTTSKTVKPVGSIKKLAVTMLVSEKRSVEPDGTITFRPRTGEELDSIQSLVSASLSLQPNRGDKIHLATIPTTQPEIDQLTLETSPIYDVLAYLPLLKIFLVATGFLFIYLLIIRPLITLLKEERVRPDIEDLDQQSLKEEEIVPEVDLTEFLRNEVLSNPAPAVHIIKKWIQET